MLKIKLNKFRTICILSLFTCASLFAGITALAQENDEAALQALKQGLESSWSQPEKNQKQEVKDDHKSLLEKEEQALLKKLEGKADSNNQHTEDKVESLADQGLIEADVIPENKPPAEKINTEVIKQAAAVPVTAKVNEPEKSDLEKAAAKTTKINQAQNRKIADLEARLREKSRELEETRSRLVLAETQVERLSSIIEKSNKQQLASYLDQPSAKSASTESNILQKPARVTQAVSSVNKSAGNEDTLVGVVSATKAYLRSGPSTNDSPIMTVSKGTRLVVETRSGGWYRVITPTGSRAWVSTEMLKFGPGAEAGSGSSVRISGYDQKQR